MITLSCKPQDSLNFDFTIEESQNSILWRFDLGLESPFFPIDDEMMFSSISLGLAKFATEVWPNVMKRTQGATFYMGSADFSKYFLWTERQEVNYKKWRQENLKLPEDLAKKIFCLEAFVHYFQMLAHKLPDELPLYLFLDVRGLGTLSACHFLMSKERLEHFEIVVRGLEHTSEKIWTGESNITEGPKPSRGVVIPEVSFGSSDLLEKLENLLSNQKCPYRVVYEPFLNGSWDEIDELYVLKDYLSPSGLRKLKGFLATGGIVHQC